MGSECHTISLLAVLEGKLNHSTREFVPPLGTDPTIFWINLPLYLNCKRLTGAIILPTGDQSCFILSFRSLEVEHQACCQAARSCIANLTAAQEPSGLSKLVWGFIFSVEGLSLRLFLWRGFHALPLGTTRSLLGPISRTEGFCYSFGGRLALWLGFLCSYGAFFQKWRSGIGTSRWSEEKGELTGVIL